MTCRRCVRVTPSDPHCIAPILHMHAIVLLARGWQILIQRQAILLDHVCYRDSRLWFSPWKSNNNRHFIWHRTGTRIITLWYEMRIDKYICQFLILSSRLIRDICFLHICCYSLREKCVFKCENCFIYIFEFIKIIILNELCLSLTKVCGL